VERKPMETSRKMLDGHALEGMIADVCRRIQQKKDWLSGLG
jgi:hypothetical protein